MPDTTEEVLGALGEYFPPAIARAVLRSTLRRGSLPGERLQDGELSDFVTALERTLPMYIVDAGRRGECIGRIRRLLPAEAREASPSPRPRPPRDTPRTPPAPLRGVAGIEGRADGSPDRIAGGVVRIRTARDVVQACDLAREVARKLGFSLLDQTKIATAASELARNILLYVGDGEVRVSVVEAPKRGIQIAAVDAGAGIPDVGLVMNSGYRSRTGMGMGLKGTKRLMDDLAIESRAGTGTTVVATKLVS
jgi:serine/threonine-protein kinase RsbT